MLLRAPGASLGGENAEPVSDMLAGRRDLLAVLEGGGTAVPAAQPDQPLRANEPESSYMLSRIQPVEEYKCTDPGDRILVALLESELPVADALAKAKRLLSQKILENLDRPRDAFVVARLLREVATVSAVINTRVQNTVGALAALQTQRRFMERHGKGDEDGV
jgi:hypothetical protein